MKSLGLSSRDNNNSKVCLKENGVAYFEPKETSGIFRKLYENLAQTLVDKLPASPKIFTMDSTKLYYEQFDIDMPGDSDKTRGDNAESHLGLTPNQRKTWDKDRADSKSGKKTKPNPTGKSDV